MKNENNKIPILSNNCTLKDISLPVNAKNLYYTKKKYKSTLGEISAKDIIKNKNGFTKQEFLQLQIPCCPFCESNDVVQWYDEKTKTRHFACIECDYYQEMKFIKINWVKKDDD